MSTEAAGALVRGRFSLRLALDGSVVAPDLAEAFVPLLRRLTGDETLGRREPCVVAAPRLLRTRRQGTGLSAEEIRRTPQDVLLRRHGERLRGPKLARRPGEASLLDVKIELARRLLGPCVLCERRCAVDRNRGETGFCGLGAGLQIGAFTNLYNEGPYVGAPTFSVFVRGCTLRCSFCYRPDELKARGRPEDAARELADVLDRAVDRGSESWHFLGGNPDESLPAILEALALARRVKPVVWNSALLLTPPALELLKGVVDVWLPDFKFGNDACALRVAQIPGYVAVLRRNLETLADEPFVVVRHMLSPGHEECCTRPVVEFVRRFPRFTLHTFPLVHGPAGRPRHSQPLAASL